MNEHQLHQQVSQYLAWALICPPAWWSTWPMGGGGEMRGKIIRGLGAKAGVPDLIFIHEGRAFFIELKAGKGRTSAVQREQHKALALAGTPPPVVAYSLDEVRGALWAWGLPLRERKPVAPIMQALAADLAREAPRGSARLAVVSSDPE